MANTNNAEAGTVAKIVEQVLKSIPGLGGATTATPGKEKKADKEDPLVFGNVHKSDISRLMFLHSYFSKIMSSPSFQASPNKQQMLMAMNTVMAQNTKEFLGQIVGPGNVDTLYGAMQGHSAPETAAYAQKLAGFQQQANRAIAQANQHRLPMDPKPRGWDQMAQMPVEQQMAMLGRKLNKEGDHYDLNEVAMPGKWTAPTDKKGNSLAPDIQYDAESRTFKRGPLYGTDSATTNI